MQAKQTQICEICFLNQSQIKLKDDFYCEKCYKLYKDQPYQFLHYQNNEDSIFSFFQASIDEIIPQKLYLGNELASQKIQTLQNIGITHILITAQDLIKNAPNQFKYLQIDIDDSYDEILTCHFDKCHEFIDSSTKVFVHCQAGMSRSPSIVISYLMKKYKLKFQESYNLVKKRRQLCQPNEGFVDQLIEYEAFLQNSNQKL